MLKNNFSGYGRIVDSDIYLRRTPTGKEVVNFCIAIPRGGESNATDFIDCCIFGARTKFFVENAKKGDIIAIEGKLHTGSSEYKGVKIKNYQVIVDDYQLFAGFGSAKKQVNSTPTKTSMDFTFQDMPDDLSFEIMSDDIQF